MSVTYRCEISAIRTALARLARSPTMEEPGEPERSCHDIERGEECVCDPPCFLDQPPEEARGVRTRLAPSGDEKNA